MRLRAQGSSRPGARLLPRQLRRVTEYIVDHLAETVRLRDLAALTGLSQSQFGRAFKVSTGVAPHRWQLNARIAKAQELLLANAMPLSEIALVTGFAKQSHLCRVFKNVIGASPRAWQRDHASGRQT